MSESDILSILALVGLVILSAFFSGSETALIAAGRIRLSRLASKGSVGAKRALRLIREPAELLAVILVGNNLVNVMAAALATMLIGPLYATLGITFVLLIFAEITPKTLAAVRPEEVSARVALPVMIFGWFFRPVVILTSAITDVLLWPFLKDGQNKDRRLSRQDLLIALRLGARDGELEPSETRMAEEVLALKDKPVRKIMISLDEVEAISESASFDEVMAEFANTGNTRYPVYRFEVHEMIGVLLVKDFLIHREGMQENWRQYVRPLMRCKASLEADELLRDMQIQHSHMAAVEDQDGTIIGLVTMEDVLEEIFGEIQDEYDDEEIELIHEVSPGRYSVHGDVEVDDMCKIINVDMGQRDQHVTLAAWFEKRAPVGSRVRRVKAGNTRVVQRGSNRFEIWIRGRAPEQEVRPI